MVSALTQSFTVIIALNRESENRPFAVKGRLTTPTLNELETDKLMFRNEKNRLTLVRSYKAYTFKSQC